jgi:hypothetical protein
MTTLQASIVRSRACSRGSTFRVIALGLCLATSALGCSDEEPDNGTGGTVGGVGTPGAAGGAGAAAGGSAGGGGTA